MSEKFSLKWNDFQTNVANCFRKLRNENDFFDVTLVSDDKQQISAHKIVLSASSEYFRSILKSNKHSHPMLCLSGVDSADLKNIIDYIYNGELQIYQEQLDQFLHMTQRFQLEGLIQDETDNNAGLEEFEEKVLQENENMDLVLNHQKPAGIFVKHQKIIDVKSANFENIEELDQKLKNMFERVDAGGTKRRCLPCGKISSSTSHAKEHAESHIDGLNFPCQHCNKTFRSRHSLRDHNFRTGGSLRSHISHNHK